MRLLIALALVPLLASTAQAADVKGTSKIDAVTVSTPDHTHAPASVRALKLGKHCFCQKPLTTIAKPFISIQVITSPSFISLCYWRSRATVRAQRC